MKHCLIPVTLSHPLPSRLHALFLGIADRRLTIKRVHEIGFNSDTKFMEVRYHDMGVNKEIAYVKVTNITALLSSQILSQPTVPSDIPSNKPQYTPISTDTPFSWTYPL